MSLETLFVTVIIVCIAALAEFRIKKDKEDYEDQLLKSQKVIHDLSAHIIKISDASEKLVEDFQTLHLIALELSGSEKQLDILFHEKKAMTHTK